MRTTSFAELAPNLERLEKRVSFLGGYYRSWEKALQEALKLRLFSPGQFPFSLGPRLSCPVSMGGLS